MSESAKKVTSRSKCMNKKKQTKLMRSYTVRKGSLYIKGEQNNANIYVAN